MSQEILGNVFEPGQKSLLCRLEVSPSQVVAWEHDATGAALDGARRFLFPLDAESVALSGDAGKMLLLTSPDGARLYAERSALEPELLRHAPGALRRRLERESGRVKGDGRKAWGALAAFVASLALVGFLGVKLLDWGVDRVIDRIPVSWEDGLGQVVVSSLQGPEIVDPKIVEPVQVVLDRLVAAGGNQPYTFTLHVVENEQVNAMAAPGGQVIVYTGLLKKAETPEELAGVLGHEIQHVRGRHGLRNVIHGLKWQLVASLLLGDVSAVQRILLAHGPQFLSLSYGRSLEEEADREGCRLLMAARIDPTGLSRFFKILQEEEARGGFAVPEILSSHPATAERIASLEAFMASESSAGSGMKPEPWQPIHADWKGMKKSLAEGPTPDKG